MSPIARCRKSVSATIIPAKKAPSASDSPVSEVKYAVPIQRQRTVRMNTSLLRLASTARNNQGTNFLEQANRATTIKVAFPIANPRDFQVSGLSRP